MKLLFDFFPILIFFICYKFFGIYTATAVAMVASLTQVVFYRIKNQHYEKMHLISLILIMVLGGATLFFHNPWFIKWKPTGIYWLSSVVFLGSSVIGKKPLIQKMMDGNINLPSKVWQRLNVAWAIFFMVMGALNLYVAYYFDTDFWVNFKLFGGAGFTLLFIFLQAIYLTRHLVEKDLEHSSSDSRS
ncbi:septation protein A [Legionella oakridgensis]|uniref:Inner membrane-spanning protein YciB n=2 Tax=Legionella oakridgensis TaxID=29423 RepID=W0BCC1_9GAMM|nr:septation protein A [Legionella oakridgensis]AHE67510.1 intracellular septation protein A [Legionella oakridgensis ATCC 33761 = DSM 21215]ETO92896.1 intracellular septation protein A [Legionella oakridgensis RV-2-2007]KTD37130.1 intracellular septation protein A [Legionella oakridgensis]STY20557.1 intracellular septation protein [Legionella longbeachae]